MRFSGRGKYKVAFNNLVSAHSVPSYSGADRGVTFEYTESVRDIYSSATANTFKTEAFKINPRDPNTFPFLSNLAKNFTQYRMNGLLFKFESQYGVSVASGAPTLGKVVLATEYNPYSPAFGSITFMENSAYATVGRPSQSMIHGIECSKFKDPLNILYMDDNVQQDDLRFENIGTFYIGSNGINSTSVLLGTLRVTYNVTLLKPRPTNTFCSDFDEWYSPTAATIINGSTGTKSLGFPSAGKVLPTVDSSSYDQTLVGFTDGTNVMGPGWFSQVDNNYIQLADSFIGSAIIVVQGPQNGSAIDTPVWTPSVSPTNPNAKVPVIQTIFIGNLGGNDSILPPTGPLLNGNTGSVPGIGVFGYSTTTFNTNKATNIWIMRVNFYGGGRLTLGPLTTANTSYIAGGAFVGIYSVGETN